MDYNQFIDAVNNKETDSLNVRNINSKKNEFFKRAYSNKNLEAMKYLISITKPNKLFEMMDVSEDISSAFIAAGLCEDFNTIIKLSNYSAPLVK